MVTDECAIKLGELPCLQILLQCTNVQYEEALIFKACIYGQEEIFNYELHIEPDEDILFTACKANQPTIVSILLKYAI